MIPAAGLRKHERLHQDKRIRQIFSSGKGFIVFPFRVVYYLEDCPENPEIQILISVPKRNVRLAVRRNRIKRLTREAYRKQKFMLNACSAKAGKSLFFSVIFLGTIPPVYSEAEDKIKSILERLCQTYEETPR